MEYGKVIFNEIEFDDDSQGTVRVSLSPDQYRRLLLQQQPFDVNVVRYGDVFYKTISEEIPDKDARLFFRANFEVGELRFCAEYNDNVMQPPRYFANYIMHAKTVESNIRRKGFDVEAAMPHTLKEDHEYCQWFLRDDEMMKNRIFIGEGMQKDITINVKRNMCFGFMRPILIDEVSVVDLTTKNTARFYEAVFYGDDLFSIESDIFMLRDILGEEPQSACFSRCGVATRLLRG